MAGLREKQQARKGTGNGSLRSKAGSTKRRPSKLPLTGGPKENALAPHTPPVIPDGPEPSLVPKLDYITTISNIPGLRQKREEQGA